MKYFRIFAFVVFLFTTCGAAGQNATDKQAEKERISQTVQRMLDNRSYQIDINYMIPLRGSARSVSSYSITIDGNSIDSYLPYFGNATSVPFGGGEGLTFKAKIESYTDSGLKKDRRSINIKVKTAEDSFVYYLEIFDNGEASVSVQSLNRDDISFRGSLNLDYKKGN